MKNLSSLLHSCRVGLFLLTFAGFVQDGQAQTGWKKNLVSRSVQDEKPVHLEGNLRLNEMSVNAVRHFKRNFPDITQETWTKNSSGYRASFHTNKYLHHAYYDAEGVFQYTVTYLDEQDIRTDLLKRIQKDFKGFSIDIITRIENDFKSVYLFTLKNQFSMKSVLVDQGEIKIIEDLHYAGL
jgi:hypothetical protein